MGRYKLGPNGGYYDPNDSGPDQFTPTPGQQVPGMPQPQAPPQQSGGFQPPIDFPQFPRTPPVPSPNGWWDHAGENDIPGYDPNNRTPHEVQPTPYTGGYDPNSPLYQGPGQRQPAPDYNALYPSIPGQGGRLIKGGGESSWVTDESLAQSQRLADEYARTGVMPQMPAMGGFWGALNGGGGQSNPYQSLSSLGGKLGGLLSGGNIQPKQPSGGIAGAIFNKFPDLFKR